MLTLTLRDYEEARARIAAHIKHTPLLTSRQLSELTGYDVRLKAENFQTRRLVQDSRTAQQVRADVRGGEKARRRLLVRRQSRPGRGAGRAHLRHTCGRLHGENATPAKIAATKGYGAEVVLHGNIWDEANEKAKELVATKG